MSPLVVSGTCRMTLHATCPGRLTLRPHSGMCQCECHKANT